MTGLRCWIPGSAGFAHKSIDASFVRRESARGLVTAFEEEARRGSSRGSRLAFVAVLVAGGGRLESSVRAVSWGRVDRFGGLGWDGIATGLCCLSALSAVCNYDGTVKVS